MKRLGKEVVLVRLREGVACSAPRKTKEARFMMASQDVNRCRWRDTSAGLAAATLLASAVWSNAYAADVHLSVDDSRGQGTLIRRGNECLIITPKHVVENPEGELYGVFSDGVDVQYGDRSRGIATALERFAEDVALLRLAEQPADGCREEPLVTAALEEILATATEAVLKHRAEEGSDRYTHVNIVSKDAYDSIEVEPTSSSGSIEEGDSGSLLYVGNDAVGMLVSVNSETGQGTVMRADKVLSVIGPFMSAAQRASSVYFALDASSAFLAPILSREAKRSGLAVVTEPGDASMTVSIESEETRIESENDRVVRLMTRVEAFDALDKLVIEESIQASGNSFISIDSAADQARKALAAQIEQAGILESLQ